MAARAAQRKARSIRMTDLTKTPRPNRWLRPQRTLALAAMAAMLLFWLVSSALYIRTIGHDLDATLAFIFQPSAAWSPAAIKAAGFTSVEVLTANGFESQEL